MLTRNRFLLLMKIQTVSAMIISVITIVTLMGCTELRAANCTSIVDEKQQQAIISSIVSVLQMSEEGRSHNEVKHGFISNYKLSFSRCEGETEVKAKFQPIRNSNLASFGEDLVFFIDNENNAVIGVLLGGERISVQ